MWYLVAVLMKLTAQILVCLKLEAVHWLLPAKVVLLPFSFLFITLGVDVFAHLVQHSRY